MGNHSVSAVDQNRTLHASTTAILQPWRSWVYSYRILLLWNSGENILLWNEVLPAFSMKKKTASVFITNLLSRYIIILFFQLVESSHGTKCRIPRSGLNIVLDFGHPISIAKILKNIKYTCFCPEKWVSSWKFRSIFQTRLPRNIFKKKYNKKIYK